jgi:hypothetical protein
MGERKLSTSMKLMPNVYTGQVCSLKTATVKNGFDVRKCVKWAHIFVETKRRRPSCVCVCDRCNK